MVAKGQTIFPRKGGADDTDLAPSIRFLVTEVPSFNNIGVPLVEGGQGIQIRGADYREAVDITIAMFDPFHPGSALFCGQEILNASLQFDSWRAVNGHPFNARIMVWNPKDGCHLFSKGHRSRLNSRINRIVNRPGCEIPLSFFRHCPESGSVNIVRIIGLRVCRKLQKVILSHSIRELKIWTNIPGI